MTTAARSRASSYCDGKWNESTIHQKEMAIMDDSFDLVSSLQTLPETDPIEVDGIQVGLLEGGCTLLTLL